LGSRKGTSTYAQQSFAKEKANDITATGKAVGFPANLKVYTGGKAPGVDKWLVYARAFDGSEEDGTPGTILRMQQVELNSSKN
jgi:hypothetical protein